MGQQHEDDATVVGRPRWRAQLFPTAGEAGGSYTAAGARGTGYAAAHQETAAERAKSEAARRARGKVRRYCVANRLNRLGTLTYAGDGCHDPAAVRSDVSGFMRGLRRASGRRFAYLWVAEWHPKGHGLHVHFAVGQFVPVERIRRAWGRGYVHIKLLGDLPVGSAAPEQARRAALYLAPYVSKTLDNEKVPGLHRYEVGQGFQPSAVRLTGATDLELLAQATEHMRAEPDRRWYSSELPGWMGPPAVWFQWARPL